jgi:hypothetical protein
VTKCVWCVGEVRCHAKRVVHTRLTQVDKLPSTYATIAMQSLGALLKFMTG